MDTDIICTQKVIRERERERERETEGMKLRERLKCFGGSLDSLVYACMYI